MYLISIESNEGFFTYLGYHKYAQNCENSDYIIHLICFYYFHKKNRKNEFN